MPQKKKIRFKHFYKRAFLNLPGKESNAYIAVRITNDKWESFEITITDCNEKINLHGTLHQIKSRKNALHKVDTLIYVLMEMKDHLVTEFKRQKLSV